ncbi:hypothetical protein CDCA_CDCA06G1861 [Cyanidium caldarium]|uniref:Transmembrane protein n=1 Tax=Cyanidium caldarium TaxID=2771 RepID=A0AAV9IUL9_CYACA|nr:hypothetical protein CDCA_CDCA06G1861 [Cyanidium caldarium]
MLPGFVYPTPLRHSVGARWVQHGRRRCDGGGARLNPPRRSRHLHRLRSADDSAPGRRPRHTPQDATLPQNDAFFSPGFDTEEVVVRRPSTPTPEQLVKPGEAEWSRQADDAHTVGFESEDLVLREPMDPTPLRTEEERRRNQPVVTLAERRRLMREWRRQREQEAARLRLQEAVREETKAQLQGAKDARVESVPLARDTLRGRETGEDYWIDLQDLVPQDGVYRGHRRPRVAALWNRVLGRTAGDEDDDGDDGGEEPGRDERAGRTVALGVDDEGAEEVAIQHLLEEMQRPAHTTVQFQELIEEMSLREGESVEDALQRSRLMQQQGELVPRAYLQRLGIDASTDDGPLTHVETSVQRRSEGNVLMLRQYVPRVAARLFELRERRRRRREREQRGRISTEMQQKVRAEIVQPYRQNWIAYIMALVGVLALLTYYFGQSSPIIELPDL